MQPFEQLQRPRFFHGHLLTAQELQQEQDYLRGMARRHNRFLHGWGIVSGLNVSMNGEDAVIVTPGLAIDCAARTRI